jgi:hypothetical protein
MAKSQYLNLQDAALLSGKSAQTIRRLIKGNKVRYRKYKTPQGFTYLVEKMSLSKHFDIDEEVKAETEEPELVEEFVPEEEIEKEEIEEDEPVVEQVYEQERSQTRPFNAANASGAPKDDQTAAGFQNVMTQLVQQHRDDKKRLFELLEIFQKRILVLEDQIKQLEAPKTKKRKFWLW